MLCSNNSELKKWIDERDIYIQNLQVTLQETEKELKEKKIVISNLKQKYQSKQRLIETPERNLQQIESALKLSDKFTINNIIDYLKLDSYEFVKTIWGVITEENAVQSVSYIDWALQRNESLINTLSKYSESKKIPETIWKVTNKGL